MLFDGGSHCQLVTFESTQGGRVAFFGNPCYSVASTVGVEAGHKLLPKQMRNVALFVYLGLRMMAEAQ